jgi:hypothetical protein
MPVSMSERQREIRRRRKRKEKLNKIKAKLEKASSGEKAKMAEQLRGRTPGAEFIIKDLELE